jgi:hypothetical protein
MFNRWCEDTGTYDLWTSEYISGLAELVKHHKTIVEVGAGDGRLSYLLARRLKETTAAAPQVIATDSGMWRIKRMFPVVQMDYARACSVLKPDCVICSWMPMGVDFSRAFRRSPSVLEYVLIGETDLHGCCGHSWLTWGARGKMNDVQSTRPAVDVFDWLSRTTTDASLHPPKQDAPPYMKDGFERFDQNHLVQFSRYDRTISPRNSKTVVFRRMK